MIIGLGHQARVGKDTAARYLVENYGFQRYAFADKLKEFTYAANPAVRAIVDDCRGDWEQAKEHAFIREALQYTGAAGRQVFNEDYWVDLVLDQITARPTWIKEDFVITDVRYPNEAGAIVALGGAVIRITRPGYSAVNNHASETALDGFEYDATVVNDSTPEELGKRVLVAAQQVIGGPS